MPAELTDQWVRFHEPFWRTLLRNVLIAVVVGAILAVCRGNLSLVGPFTLLAMWFTLGGHYVEVVFLNRVRYRLPKTRASQVLGRLSFWFLGGCVLYLGMSATMRLLTGTSARYRDLWIGGILLMGIEAVVHIVGLLRRKQNFYLGTG